jgi:hypothetical protein
MRRRVRWSVTEGGMVCVQATCRPTTFERLREPARWMRAWLRRLRQSRLRSGPPDGGPADPDGGVREPRRPSPVSGAGAVAIPLPFD